MRETMKERSLRMGDHRNPLAADAWLSFSPEEQTTYRQVVRRTFELRDEPIAVAMVPLSRLLETVTGANGKESSRWTVPSAGLVRMMIEVDLRNFRNADILAQLGEILESCRSDLSVDEETTKIFKGPSDKGSSRLSLYQTRLAALGLMRLRYAMDVPEIIALFKPRETKPWDNLESPKAASGVSEVQYVREFISKRKETAKKYYLKLFDKKLGKDSLPEHYTPPSHLKFGAGGRDNLG